MTCNAEMGPSEVRDFCKTDASGERLLKAAMQQLHLSARTIADLVCGDMIAANQVAKAIHETFSTFCGHR